MKQTITCFVAYEHENVGNVLFAVKRLPKRVKLESTSALKYIASHCNTPYVLISAKPELLHFTADSLNRFCDLLANSKAMLAYSDYIDEHEDGSFTDH